MKYKNIKKLRTIVFLTILGPILGCAGTDKSKLNLAEPIADICEIAEIEFPKLILLNSTELGGKYSDKIKSAFVGSIPAKMVIYDNNTIIFARNISKNAEQPFYGYFCGKLPVPIVSELEKDLGLELQEDYEVFDTKDRNQTQGMSEVIAYESEYNCKQYELLGSLENAAEISTRSRSSVVDSIPDSVQRVMSFTEDTKLDNLVPFFPRTALIHLIKTQAPLKGTAWPSKKMPLLELDNEKIKLKIKRTTKVFKTSITRQSLPIFAALMRKIIHYKGHSYRVNYRFLLPKSEYWAAPYPTRHRGRSVCNSYASKNNFFLLYGVN
jgi:hypothetical protein